MGEMKDLEEAIQTAWQAVESTPANYTSRALVLNSLGNELGRRCEQTLAFQQSHRTAAYLREFNAVLGSGVCCLVFFFLNFTFIIFPIRRHQVETLFLSPF
jgi:hypothetical protein